MAASRGRACLRLGDRVWIRARGKRLSRLARVTSRKGELRAEDGRTTEMTGESAWVASVRSARTGIGCINAGESYTRHRLSARSVLVRSAFEAHPLK